MGNELLKIAEGFSIVAEGLRGLAKAEGGTKDKAADTGKAQKQDAAKVQPEPQQENPATLEGIRALMAQKTQEGKSNEVKGLLQKFGAAKLSAVYGGYHGADVPGGNDDDPQSHHRGNRGFQGDAESRGDAG